MKRLKFFFLICCVAWMSVASGKTIWTGSQPIDWNNNGSASVEASAFADAQIADVLTFKITFTGGTDWPQISLIKPDWKPLSNVSNTAVDAQTTEVKYVLTRDMLTDLQENGMMITGCGFTLNGIELETGAGSDGYEHAVWIGERAFPTDWSGYQTLPASCFSKAQVGTVVRFHVQDLKAGAQLLPKKADWNGFDGVGGIQLSGTYADLELTTDILSELQANGMIVQGVGFTLTSIDLIGEQEQSKLQLSVPVTNDWLWADGTQPSFRVNITNPTAADVDATVDLQISDDKRLQTKTYHFGSEAVEAGKTANRLLSVADTFEPGFYIATISVNGELARSMVFGISPQNIVSAPDMQSDFEAFWTKAKADLKAVDGQYTLTEIPAKSTSKRKVYLVEMQSAADKLGAGIVRAYYAEPTAAGTYPAIIHYNGYDGGTYDPWCMGGDDNPGYCELIVSTRGQLINNRAPYENQYGDWFQFGFESKDNYYYRGAYLDAVRAIDFMCSREKVQQMNIFAEGASQGGALTLAAAALDDRLNAIAPAIPFMGDFPDYFQIVSWPANAAQSARQKAGMTEADMFTMLSYFDMKNLATWITCPVRMDYSLQDNVCPPHTNWASYNNLASAEKSYRTNPTLGHETPSAWYSDYMAFFANHMKDPAGIQAVEYRPAAAETHAVYDLQGRKVAADAGESLPKGIYIVGGRKVVR